MGFYCLHAPCLFLFLLTLVQLCRGLIPPGEQRDLVSNEVHHRHRYWTYLSEKYPKRALNFTLKDVQLGCRELRSKKYISDGYCTSMKPILEVVCTGVCLPVADLPWYNELLQQKSYRDIAGQWRCINGRLIKEKVHLICQDGTERAYKVRLVKSCKCKKNHGKRNHYNPLL